MSKTTIFILLLVCISFAHKDKRDERKQTNSIYKPFTDLPSPSQEVIIVDPIEKEQKKLPDQYEQDQQRSEQKQQQIQEFNQMLEYGLVFGTILLACMLFRTCGNHRRHMRQHRVALAPASQNMMTHVPMLNKAPLDIKNKIEWHKMEIKRLEQEAKQIEQAEVRAMQERKRQEQTIKAYYGQVELQETMQAYPSYNQQFYPQYQYNGNIPVGRPIPVPKDNDSSFASQYPTI